MSDDQDARVVLVTGAGRGLGVEIARQLVDAGTTVVLGARDAEAGRTVAEKLGHGAWSVPLDVTDASSIDAAIDAVRERYGRLDGLVNNAAVSFDAGADPVTEDLDVAEAAWHTNVLGPWRLTQAATPLLRAGRDPVIVNVTSGLGSLQRMGAYSPAYSVSKAAVNALTRVFADALADDGITVQAVSPGWTATDMGGPGGRSVSDGAAGIVEIVTSPSAHPTGSFLLDGQPVAW